jgi:hypothetical protein
LRVHEHPVDVGEGVVAGGALALEAGGQLLPRLEDLFDQQVGAAGDVAEPLQVPLGVGQAVRVVDPQAVREPLAEPAHHFLMCLVEDGGELHADAGERVHRKEAAVVQLVVRAPPAHQLVVLPGVDVAWGVAFGVAAVGQREAVIVVPELPVLDFELVQVIVAAEDREPDAPPAKVPVDVERFRVTGLAPLFEQRPPPGVLHWRGHADVVGHDVDQHAHAGGSGRLGDGGQALRAAALGVDGGGIGDVVPVVGALLGSQDR